MNVNNIGHETVSPEESRWRKYYRELMVNVGMMPGYYDGGTATHSKKEKRLSVERFSTNYKTRDEFEDDRLKILNYMERREYAPEDLVNKVMQTIKELDLQFGD